MNVFQKKEILIVYVFWKSQTVKQVVRQISKKSCFRRPLNKQHGKWAKELLKSAQQQLCHIYWSLWKHLNWKNLLLVICKILGLVFNTMIADDKYSPLYKSNLTESIHIHNKIYWSLWMQLSWKKSLLVICKIVGLFFNTLTAGDKYSLFNKGNLTQLIQIQLSKKQKTFSHFLKLFWNLN